MNNVEKKKHIQDMNADRLALITKSGALARIT